MLASVVRWVVVALAVSLLGAAEGFHLMGSLNEPIPGVLEALHGSADEAEREARRPARRVVVVLIDGLGGEAFDARVREGILGDVAWSASLDSGVPSRSRPVYHALLTGVPQWVSGIRANGPASERADSVPDRVRAGGGKVAWMLEEVPWFCELFCGPGDLVVVGPSVTSPETFTRVWDAAPDLLVLHLTKVDDAGHLFGAQSEPYEEASRDALGIVATFRDIARTRPGGRDAIWFVGADHGHTAYGGHGGSEESVRRITWVALFGPDLPREDAGHPAPAPMTPVTALAPTIARALGVAAPRESMADGLPLLTAQLGPPLRASPLRAQATMVARAGSDARLLGNARSRAVLIAFVLAATVLGLVAARRRRGLAEAGVLVIAIGGFFLLGPGLSMSAVRTEIGYLARGLFTLTVFAAAAWVAARRWASAHVLSAICGIFPVLALVAMRGSLGRSDVTPLESVLWPSLGLVPPSVCAAIALVEMAHALRAHRRRRSRARVGVAVSSASVTDAP